MSYPSKTEFDNLRNSLPLTYQTRGNYAFRTDLASNINTALRNVNTALAAYAKKTDIPIVPANVATKTDLAGYALASDLGKYQPAGKYVSPSELEAYQPKGDYALAKDLVSYAKSSDLANFQPKGEYALAADLASYAKESSLASYQPKGDYAAKTDLAGYAKESSLASYQPKGDYAAKSDLAAYALLPTAGSYALQSELASYQPKGDYAAKSDIAAYAKAAEGLYQFKGNYALKPTAGSYALQADLANLQPKGNYALQPTAGSYALQADLGGYQTKGNNYAFQTDLVGYAKTTDLGGYAKTTDLGGYAKTTDLGGYAKTTDLGSYAKTTDLGIYQPKGNYQTAGSYALKTDLAIYAKSSDLANLQPKGNYALQPTAGSYALQADLAGYAKTAGATTFGGQATFDKNAIVKTEGAIPFDVLGTGGLRVSGGSLTVTGDSYLGGSLKVGGARFVPGTDDWVRMIDNAGVFNYGLAGKNVYANAVLVAADGGTDSQIKTPDGNTRITRHGVQFGGNNITGFENNSAQISAGVHVPNSLNIVGMGTKADNRKVDMWAEGGLTVNGPVDVSGAQRVAGNKSISTQGLHFQWNRSGSEGESWIINQQGGSTAGAGIRFGKSDDKNAVTEFGRFDNDGTFKVSNIIATNISAANIAGLDKYALKTELTTLQGSTGALQTNLDNYALKTSLDSYALQSSLLSYTKAAEGLYQPKGDYAAKTALGGYQPKGDYALQTSLAGYQTAGSYALKTDLAGYAKTAGATTFGGQATFDKNAIVKTEGVIPFEVSGPGGLRVTGGGLTVTGNSTFGGNLNANHMFLESGTDPSLRLGPNIKDTGTARLNVQEKIGNYMKFFMGTTEKGSITNTVDNGVEVNVGKVNAWAADIKGTLSLALDNKNGGIDLTNTTKGSGGIYMANGAKDYTTDSAAGDMVIRNNKGTMRFLHGSGGSAMTIDSNNAVNISGSLAATSGSISTFSSGNASITNLTIGNMNMTGAPTFSSQATFSGNATVTTGDTKPFQVTGPGGLKVAGPVVVAGGISGDLSVTGNLGVTGDSYISGTNHAKEIVTNNWKINSDGSTLTFKNSTNPTTQAWLGGRGGLEVIQFRINNSGILLPAGVDTTEVYNGENSIKTGKVTADNASITNLTIGNMNMTGAPTFSSQATFSGNAIVKTEGTIPFQVTGAGGLRVTGGGLTVTGDSTFSGKLNVANIINIGELSATSGSISTFSSDNASITNLTIGNMNMTGAPTFSSQATFSGNATVKTTDYKPFEVTGPGGLRVSGGSLSLSFDNKIGGIDLTNTTKGSGGIYMANLASEYTTDSAAGDMVIRNNKGTMRFVHSGNASAMTIDSNNAVNFPGGATLKGATTFKALATFENNATVTTSANIPFKVTGPGGLKVGDATFVAGGLTTTDDWVRISADGGKSYNYGLAGKNLYANAVLVASDGGTDSQIKTPDGNTRITQHGIQFGGANKTGFENNSAQISAGVHVPNSLNIVGMGGDSANRKVDMWAEGGLTVNGPTNITGSLAANHMFLESGTDPSLRLGPGIKDTGTARLNVQDKSGNYMKFFAGTTETGSITHDGGTSLNVDKVNAWAAKINGNLSLAFDNKIGGIDLTNTTKGSGGIYMANGDTDYTTDSKAGDMVIRNNKGTMRFVHSSNASAMTIDSNNAVNFPGKSLNFGGATFVVGGVGGTDDWVRMHESSDKAYNYGLAAKKFWTDGDLDVGGTTNLKGTVNAPNGIRIGRWFIGPSGTDLVIRDIDQYKTWAEGRGGHDATYYIKATDWMPITRGRDGATAKF